MWNPWHRLTGLNLSPAQRSRRALVALGALSWVGARTGHAQRVPVALEATSHSVLASMPSAAPPQPRRPIEIHQRIARGPAQVAKPLALTLDACSGAFDADLIQTLLLQRIAATLFVTQRWIRANPAGVALLRAHLDLFQIENHGARHVPAVVGPGRRVYGIAGHTDVDQLRAEVQQGAAAIAQAFGTTPRWYRAATAMYDASAVAEIERLGFQVAGFSLNADAGASLPRRTIERRLQAAQPGDIAIAHLNRPRGDTAEALQTALPALVQAGFGFVRLDQVQIERTP